MSQISKSLSRISESFDTKIIIFLRRQDLFQISIYKQVIQEVVQYHLQTFLKSFDYKSINWNNILADFSKNFGKENIIFENVLKRNSPKRNSLYHEFGEILDSHVLKSSNNVKKINISISIVELEFMLIINKYLSPKYKTYTVYTTEQ